MSKTWIYIIFLALVMGCENHDLNEGPEFRPKVIEDSYKPEEFSIITVDGVEYLIMERDNNNPHEGFGFMAFKADALLKRQDSILAYLKANQTLQVAILSRLSGQPTSAISTLADSLFLDALK